MTREVPIGYIEPPQPPPPLSHTPKSNLPMLYYGLVVVGTAAIVLTIYNLIIIKWCTQRQSQQPVRRRPNSSGFVEATTTASQSFDNVNRNLLSSFKYRKDMNITGGQGQGREGNYEYECSVCLSVFEEGEEVRQLPRCKHSFHASCIDMWLYSHFDCPLCRSPVQVTRCLQLVDSQEHSRENLLQASGISPPTS